MAIDQSRPKSMFGRFGPIAAVLVLLLSGTLTGLNPTRAQEIPDQNQGGQTASPPTGGSIAGSEYGTVEVKSRDANTRALIKGGCYYVWSASRQMYFPGCDAWDLNIDGVTTVNVYAEGLFDVGVLNPPPDRFYIPRKTGVQVTFGVVKHLSFNYQGTGSTDVIIRSRHSNGAPVTNVCYSLYVDAGGGSLGQRLTNYICDYFDGASDGVTTLSGFWHEPSTHYVAVPTQLSGFKLPPNQAFTLRDGADNRLTFTFSPAAYSPKCTTSRSSGTVGVTVRVNCQGFPRYQYVRLYWDGRATAQLPQWTYDTGKVSFSFVIPARPAGAHYLRAKSESHAAPRNQFTIVSSVAVTPISGKGGSTAKATLRGFGKGETVNIRIQGSRRILATVVVSSTGSGSVSFSILNGAAADLVVVAEGNAGHVAKDGFRRTGPAPTPTPNQTATATPTGTPTATSTATASPSVTSTSTATATNTATATATSTSTDTATPTATSTETVVAPPAEVIPATPTG